MAELKNTEIDDTGFFGFPAGTTSQRPSDPEEGTIRINTDYDVLEYWDGYHWRHIAVR